MIFVFAHQTTVLDYHLRKIENYLKGICFSLFVHSPVPSELPDLIVQRGNYWRLLARVCNVVPVTGARTFALFVGLKIHFAREIPHLNKDDCIIFYSDDGNPERRSENKSKRSEVEPKQSRLMTEEYVDHKTVCSL